MSLLFCFTIDSQAEGAAPSLVVYMSGCAQCCLGRRNTQHATRVTEYCSVWTSVHVAVNIPIKCWCSCRGVPPPILENRASVRMKQWPLTPLREQGFKQESKLIKACHKIATHSPDCCTNWLEGGIRGNSSQSGFCFIKQYQKTLCCIFSRTVIRPTEASHSETWTDIPSFIMLTHISFSTSFSEN